MKHIFFAIILISFFSCNQNSERILPSSTGSAGQLLVIMDEHKWEQEPGRLLKEAITADYELLPQSEPLFNISQIPIDAYSKILQRNRNILYTQISVNVKKNEVLIAYDKHSSPQMIVTVKAKSDEEFIELLNKQKERIIKAFQEAERNRLIKAYSGKFSNKSVKETVEKNHHVSLSFPKGYTLDVDSTNFAWLSRETPYSTEAILIWNYNYHDTAQFEMENLLKIRDSITKKFVPGPADSSYMINEDLISPIYREFLLNNKYTAEMRGLWKIGGAEGVFMGGPFVSFSTVDTKRNRIVTVDGFVYGGKKKKRDLLKQVEAILYTLKITD